MIICVAIPSLFAWITILSRMTSVKLDTTGHRWLASLGTYNFSLKYKTGKTNRDADGLSRRP